MCVYVCVRKRENIRHLTFTYPSDSARRGLAFHLLPSVVGRQYISRLIEDASPIFTATSAVCKGVIVHTVYIPANVL